MEDFLGDHKLDKIVDHVDDESHHESNLNKNLDIIIESAEKDSLDILESGQKTIDLTDIKSGLDTSLIQSIKSDIFLPEKLATIQNKIYISLSKLRSYFITHQESFDKSKLFQGEFLAEEELEKVKKAPRDERAKLVNDIKEKIVAQQECLAKAQVNLINEIKKSPDTPISELYDRFVEETSNFGINYNQKDLALRSLRAYSERHQAIRELKNKYPDTDNLFKALFGKTPIGKIELKEGPITLYFKCYNLEDYCQIYYCQDVKRLDEINNSNLGDFYKEKASLSGGLCVSNPGPVSEPELVGVIVAENSCRGNTEKRSQDIFNHEEQHSINRIFEEKYKERNVIDRLREAKTDENIKLALINLIAYRREYVADQKGKNESLAYLKAGAKNIRSIKKKLTDQSVYALYDYMAPLTSLFPVKTDDANSEKMLEAMRILDSENPDLQLGSFRQKYFVDKYQNLLREGLDSMKKMQRMGYSNDDIIALLTHEPLERWSKVVNRIKKLV